MVFEQNSDRACMNERSKLSTHDLYSSSRGQHGHLLQSIRRQLCQPSDKRPATKHTLKLVCRWRWSFRRWWKRWRRTRHGRARGHKRRARGHKRRADSGSRTCIGMARGHKSTRRGCSSRGAHDSGKCCGRGAKVTGCIVLLAVPRTIETQNPA